MNSLIIANWKMNLNLNDTIQICDHLVEKTFDKTLLIAASTPYLALLKHKFPRLVFAAQDVSIKQELGAFTGEVSASQLHSIGINYAIIGHSERRTNFTETDSVVRQKATNCINKGITPIICIGESAELRKERNYKNFLIDQLHFSIPKTEKQIIIAYEPLWSIGTNITPTTFEIKEIADLIKNEIANSLLAKSILLVYGGSVNSENSRKILKFGQVDGLLVGGASLITTELIKILNS